MVWRQQGLACRCMGGADMQQSLLVRLQNLCQLEALLAHTLTILPHLLPGQTPTTAQPKAAVSSPHFALVWQPLCCQFLALLLPQCVSVMCISLQAGVSHSVLSAQVAANLLQATSHLAMHGEA